MDGVLIEKVSKLRFLPFSPPVTDNKECCSLVAYMDAYNGQPPSYDGPPTTKI